VGVNGSGSVVWNRPLSAAPIGMMACDAGGRVYLGTKGAPADEGFYCIDASHNIAWHQPVSGICMGITVAAKGFCAGIYIADEAELFAPAKLVGYDEL
jgi:hypothetical protein